MATGQQNWFHCFSNPQKITCIIFENLIQIWRNLLFSYYKEQLDSLSFLPQILPSLFHDYPAEENQGNQIRYCHQCIENVCQIPYEVETDYGTEIYGNQENNPVDIDDRLDSETLLKIIYLSFANAESLNEGCSTRILKIHRIWIILNWLFQKFSYGIFVKRTIRWDSDGVEQPYQRGLSQSEGKSCGDSVARRPER